MSTTRAKFHCHTVSVFAHGGKEVKLSVVYVPTPNGTENHKFTKATPSGEITMRVDNPEASVQFVPGHEYYVDFTDAALTA